MLCLLPLPSFPAFCAVFVLFLAVNGRSRTSLLSYLLALSLHRPRRRVSNPTSRFHIIYDATRRYIKRIHDEEQGHGAYRARAMSVDLTAAAPGRTPPGSRGVVRETG